MVSPELSWIGLALWPVEHGPFARNPEDLVPFNLSRVGAVEFFVDPGFLAPLDRGYILTRRKVFATLPVVPLLDER